MQKYTMYFCSSPPLILKMFYFIIVYIIVYYWICQLDSIGGKPMEDSGIYI